MTLDAPTLAQLIEAAASGEPSAAMACTGLPPGWFFPERDAGTDNHGGRAKAACRVCPVREACLLSAVARNEVAGIWGGAGEARRRRLRAVRGDEVLLRRVLDAHWRQLDGRPLPGDVGLLASFGGGATHAKRSTQSKGCRCGGCVHRTSVDGVEKNMGCDFKVLAERRRQAVAA